MIDLSVDPDVRGRLERSELGKLRTRLERMLKAAGLTEDRAEALEASLRLVSDETIHVLNRDYRRSNNPTDVLAFSQREGDGGQLHPHLLGDIVISLDTAKRQCGRKGLSREVLFLATHGLCHLLGHDHNTDAEEASMNERITALLAEANRRRPVRPA